MHTTPPPSGRPAFYALEFFPYPSGEGLSVGHLRNYVGGDVVARYQRMRGYDVLHPMGWDAFGLPAENEARERGRHPEVTTRQYAANYRRQLNLVSVGYDWSREIFSSDPDYYRWTQWIFLRLHARGLAYRGHSRQWWCPDCATVMANEQIEWQAGQPVCWRGHGGVHRRRIAQWFLRTTAYAQRLLDGLEALDWPEGILAMQRHWIGRSEGAGIDFEVIDDLGEGEADRDSSVGIDRISVFTTRPDTIFGVTALVLAPEHPGVARWTRPERREAVESYVAAAARRSEIERQSTEGEKTGVDTGAQARHPLTGEALSVWVADYVLPEVGSGALMLVPAHDERDAAFAVAHDIPARRVIRPTAATDAEVDAPDDVLPFVEPGILVDSGDFDGLTSEEGGRAILQALEQADRGRAETRWRMRDWSVGRQRFWGAPIPIVHCPDCGEVPVPDSELPVRLPEVERVPLPGRDAQGRPVSPLAAIPEFVDTRCPRCGADARRETDTLDGFACSSWYFLRFTSPRESDRPFDPEAVARWMPVDLYVGGAEHAVMHLLYARFWTQFLHDEGLLPMSEPFARLRNQGMVLDETGRKMSKSRPETLISPDEAVRRHGADAIRACLMFIAPFDQDVPWSEEGAAGMRRWLGRVWRLVEAPAPTCLSPERARAIERSRHRCVRDLGAAIEALRFNVAIARLMEWTKELDAIRREAGRKPARSDASEESKTRVTAGPAAVWEAALDALLRVLAPFAPHLAEELWHRRGGAGSIHQADWPDWDPERTRADEVEIAVQVEGRLRARIRVPAGTGEVELRARALAEPAVADQLGGLPPERVIIVPDRLINLLPGTGEST